VVYDFGFRGRDMQFCSTSKRSPPPILHDQRLATARGAENFYLEGHNLLHALVHNLPHGPAHSLAEAVTHSLDLHQVINLNALSRARKPAPDYQ
jgi:hypothetical protein